MNFLELARKRCSVRQYLPTPIEEEKLNYILEAGRMAPSAANLQPWYFLLITEEEGRQKVAECYPRDWVKPAPAFIVICGDHEQSWKRSMDGKDHLDIDTGILLEQICLAATDLSLATCIICHFDTALLSHHFNLPKSVEPIAIIPIAYPADPSIFDSTPKKRKPLEEIVRKERF